MGKINPDLAGSFRGKIGKAVYYNLGDMNCVRSLGEKGSKKELEGKQLCNCMKMKILGKLGGVVAPILQVTMPKELFRTGTFIEWNYGAVTVEDEKTGDVSVDYPSLVFSKGSLMPAIVTGTRSGNTINVECAPQTGYGLAADDQVILAFVDGENGFAWLVMLGSRGEGGSASVTVPPFCSPESVFAYTFVMSQDRKKISKSVPITLGTGE